MNKKITEILDKLPLGLLTFNHKHKLTFVNRKTLDLFECLAGELPELTIEQASKKMEQGGKEVLNFIKSGSAFESVLGKVLTKAGMLNIILGMYRLAGGDYIFFFEEAKKQQELDNLQLQTETILNSVNNMIVICDKNDRIIKCNRAFEEILEIDAGKIIGMARAEFEEMIGLSVDKADINSTTEGVKTVEYSLLTPKGNQKNILVQPAAIYNLDGDIIGIIRVITDITEIKRNEEEIKQQEKMALLGQMASGIVHEVRNPLTAIMGFNQIIRLKEQDEEIRQICSLIDGEIQRLNNLVSSFLQFAKPKPPVLKEENPDNLIESIKMLIDTNLFAKGIKVSYDLCEDVPAIMADENQIRQVILNIIKNAIDALNKTDTPEIKISTGYDPLFMETFIKIYNNGKIISKEEIERIGIPFYTTKTKGTGLGLSICNRIMHEHSGRISIRSQEEYGTEFELAFPAISIYDNP